jgi:peptide deformylase
VSILKVARIGHPVIRTATRRVPKAAFRDPGFQKLIDDMRETMYEYEGVGLAGPQVHESLQLAVLEIPGSDDRSRAEVPFTVLVNPTITPLGEELENGWEGCLSIPDLRGVVPRLPELRLEALDRDGKRFSLEASGFFARVIQHECDHLGGHVYLVEAHVRRNEDES